MRMCPGAREPDLERTKTEADAEAAESAHKTGTGTGTDEIAAKGTARRCAHTGNLKSRPTHFRFLTPFLGKINESSPQN